MRNHIWSVILATCLAGCGGVSDPDPAPPDVFLVVIDTLRADRMSAYGWPRPTTPRLDRLAQEGVRFADVTAQSSWTKPSMVSLWTGQYVTAYQDKVHADQPHLVEALRDEGYATIGVAGNVLLSEVEGFDRGFDHYDARRLTLKERMAREREVGESGPCRDAADLIADFLRPIDAFLADAKPDGEAGRQPLFGYLHPMEPHAPYLEHPDLVDEFPLGFEEGRFPAAWHAEAWNGVEHPAFDPPLQLAEAWSDMAAERVRYERELRYLDDLLAGLLTALEERDLLGNAVLIVASDHGEGLFDHLELRVPEELAGERPEKFFQKQHGSNLSQELVATPLIVWDGRRPEGRVVEAPVENVDVFPTLLELCGASPEEALHGRSLVPLLRGETTAHKPHVHSFVMTKMMIRDAATGHKLVLPTRLGTDRGAQPALYDLGADPAERSNLIRDLRSERETLSKQLTNWQAAHPTRATNALMKDPTTLQDLRALGYLGDE